MTVRLCSFHSVLLHANTLVASVAILNILANFKETDTPLEVVVRDIALHLGAEWPEPFGRSL